VSDNETQRRIKSKLQAELGEDVMRELRDDSTVEVMLNDDGKLWVEKLGKGMEVFGEMTQTNAFALLGTVAASLETVVTAASPVVEGELLLDGSRFQGMIPPVVTKAVFAIRKPASLVFSLDSYVENGIMTEPQKVAICEAVAAKDNIVVVGGTGSGKTTLGNAVIKEISEADPESRVVVIEDTRELQVESKNCVRLRANKTTSMLDLLKSTMRMRPDRIIVGEVRDGSALTLLKSWNTGHPGGLATVHANSARAALGRIEQLVLEVARNPMRELIGEAVNVIVYIERTPEGREIKELCRVRGFDPQSQEYIVESIQN